jgi:hypothetical protein
MPLVYTLLIGIPQKAIQIKMQERLETNHLRTITVPENDIHWIKDGKEIWVNGRMFDIKSSHSGMGFMFFPVYTTKRKQCW